MRAPVWGPGGEAPLSLVLDTGSWQTLVVPDVMDDLGFNPRDGEGVTSVYSAIGKGRIRPRQSRAPVLAPR